MALRSAQSDLSKTTGQQPSPDSSVSTPHTLHISSIKHTQAPFPAHLVTDGSSDEAAGAAASLRRETGYLLCWVSFNQMTSKAGFSGRQFSFQRSSIKELMGLGGGAGPSVLNYPEAGGRLAWGQRALPARLSWLPLLSCLAPCLPATPDSECLTYLSCLSHLSV